MAGRTCALVGCSKACASMKQLACGELHHLLLMAGRYASAPQHFYQRIQDRNAAKLCALASCSKAPSPGHPWCSRTHYLDWLSRFYAALSPLQICRLPGCNRHVCVSDIDEVPPSQFCGWRHCQKFAMLAGIERQQQNEPQLVESEGDHHVAPVKSLLHAFEDFVHKGIPPKGVKVDNEFFSKHPWEVLAEGHHECYVIARCKFASTRKNKQQRDLVTKDQYHWKQQGSPKDKGGFCRKYFSYKKLNGTTKEAAAQHDDGVYTMKEYIIDGVDHSFVKLSKGAKKARKGRKRRRVDDDTKASHPLSEAPPRALTPACSQDLPAWDWDFVDDTMACCLQTSHPQSEALPRALIPDLSQDLPLDLDSLGSAGPRQGLLNGEVLETLEKLFGLDDFSDEMPSTGNVFSLAHFCN